VYFENQSHQTLTGLLADIQLFSTCLICHLFIIFSVNNLPVFFKLYSGSTTDELHLNATLSGEIQRMGGCSN